MSTTTERTEDEPTLLEALRERARQGNDYVKARHVTDEVAGNAISVGLQLSELEEDGYLERYRETSTGTVWRMTEDVQAEEGRR